MFFIIIHGYRNTETQGSIFHKLTLYLLERAAFPLSRTSKILKICKKSISKSEKMWNIFPQKQAKNQWFCLNFTCFCNFTHFLLDFLSETHSKFWGWLFSGNYISKLVFENHFSSDWHNSKECSMEFVKECDCAIFYEKIFFYYMNL